MDTTRCGDLENRGPGTWGPGVLGTWTPGDMGGEECCAHAGREWGGDCAGGCKSPVLSFGAVAIQQRVLAGNILLPEGQSYICVVIS